MTTETLSWFGPEFIAEGWAPAPRYLLRRARILHHMKNLKPGDVVEVGCASGGLLSELTERGFRCTGVETSKKAISLARRVNQDNAIEFRSHSDDAWAHSFDYCLSFEVLEHIEDDSAALAQWSRWVRPGGKMLLSVPAHPRLWNARDVWAGHIRRYRRADLEKVFAEAGLTIEKIECYGFPLANVLELIFARSTRHYPAGGADDNANSDKAKQTAASGIERTTDIKMFPLYARFPGSLVMRAMIMVQNLFLGVGFGNGYLVIATKPHQR